MSRLGFTSFDNQTPHAPTVPEILAAMTGTQKQLVLEGFVKKIRPQAWRQWVAEDYADDLAATPTLNRVPRKAISVLYLAIDQIEEKSRSLMRGEVMITAAILPDPTIDGDEGTPAVYNTPPTTATQLKNAIADEFVDTFTAAQTTAILSKMVKWAKQDGTGTWAYYAVEVKK